MCLVIIYDNTLKTRSLIITNGSGKLYWSFFFSPFWPLIHRKGQNTLIKIDLQLMQYENNLAAAPILILYVIS